MAATSLFLLHQRAKIAVKELQHDGHTTSKARNLDFILDWFEIKKLFNGKSSWIPESAAIYGQIIRQETLNAPKLSAQCKEECPEQVFKDLAQSDQHIAELQQLNIKLGQLTELSQRLKIELAQRLKMHVLLAKDFEVLVGSPSLYTEDQKNEILYFVSGPFKWLPLLDTTKTINKSAEINDFSSRLEKLREQSKAIVEEYQSLKLKEKTTIEEQSATRESLETTRNSILQSLSSAWNSEL